MIIRDQLHLPLGPVTDLYLVRDCNRSSTPAELGPSYRRSWKGQSTELGTVEIYKLRTVTIFNVDQAVALQTWKRPAQNLIRTAVSH